MNKKWLYSVAMGVLLLAGKIFGITAPEVLDMNFNDYRNNEQDMRARTKYSERATKYKTKTLPDGSLWSSYGSTAHSSPLYVANWMAKYKYSTVKSADGTEKTSQRDSTFKYNYLGNREKSKITTVMIEQNDPSTGIYVFHGDRATAYTSSGKGDPQGLIPISSEYFDENIKKLGGEVSKSEHKATTNASTSEVVIEGTIYREGIVPVGDSYETAILTQDYTKSITTKGNTIMMTQNFSAYQKIPGQKGWIDDITSTENTTIQLGKRDRYKVKSKVNYSQTTTSVRNEPDAVYGLRPGVVSDEHTQSMLDELNRSAGVRVVVRSTKEPPTTLAAAGSGKAPVQQQEDQQSGNNSAARTGQRVRVIRNPSFNRRKLNGGNEGI